MTDWKKLQTSILADGKIDDHEVEMIRRELYADGKIDKDEVQFLIALRNEAREVCPAFEELFFEAVKQNVLTDGSIDAEEAVWLREMLYADGKIDERERKFLWTSPARSPPSQPRIPTTLCGVHDRWCRG